jgi:hypothetical protein
MRMDRHFADTSRALDVLHIPGAPAFLIDGEAQHSIHLHDIGKMELTNLFQLHPGIQRNQRSPES